MKIKLAVAVYALILGTIALSFGTNVVAQSQGEEPLFQCPSPDTLTGDAAAVADLISQGAEPAEAVETVLKGLENPTADAAAAITQSAICASPGRATEITNAAMKALPVFSEQIADAGVEAGADPLQL